MSQLLTIDFDKQSDKVKLFEVLKGISGVANVEIRDYNRSNGRYRYYFGYVLTKILHTGLYLYPNAIGKLVKATNTAQIHELMKFKYNPILTVDPATGEMIKLGGGTTTVISDTEFISKYQEQIIADHSGEPFFIEFN